MYALPMPKPHELAAALTLADWSAANLPIRFFGDSGLYNQCVPFEQDEFGSSEMVDLASQLTETLGSYREYAGMGRGLAANQIGSNRRMIVVWLDEPLCLVNPIPRKLHGQGTGWESCLSSGTMLIGEVVRPWTGIFDYFSIDGKQHQLIANPGQTRLLLHEVDHLNGNICTNKYEPKTTRFVTGGRSEILGYELKQLSSQ